MNPLLLIGAAALAFLAMGGKKAKASSEPAVKVNVPPVKLVPKQEDGDQDADEAPAAPPPPRVNIGPAIVQPPPSAGTMKVTNADTGIPVTKDDATAKKNAQSMADHVRNKGNAYSRPQLAVWQAMAGLAADGLYGPATANKLRGYGAKNVPANLFKGAKK